MKGMIVYSFGWRRKGHSPCNIRLAMAAKGIVEAQTEPVLVIAQRSTASILKELGIKCCSVQKHSGYEGSEEVTRQATELFRELNITEVIPLAQPIFQLHKCLLLTRREGFKTASFWQLAKMIGWIGFDKLSVQPATQDFFRLVFYTIRQILFGYRPSPELSEP